MDIIQAIILAVVEGISEFLPISSTGHLVLTTEILGISQTDFVKSFEIIIQLGAILAVVTLYWKTLIKNPIIWQKIIIAFIPTAILGLIFYKIIKEVLLGNPLVTVLALFIGGIILIILEKMYQEKPHHLEEISKMSTKQALGIGLIQSFSMIPGTSRAAATIIGGMFLGLKRSTATEFSFLLAIPTMTAATGLDLIKSDFAFSGQEYLLLAIGLVGAFITALLVMKWLIKYVQKNTFVPFGIYRIILALVFWALFIQ